MHRLSLALLFISHSVFAGHGWVGNFTTQLTREDASALCDDTRGVEDATVVFDSWARTRAVRTNLCFEVYVPGVTDRPELAPGALDIFVNAPNKFNARFVEKRGNNYLYLFDLRDLDPVPHGISLSGNLERELRLEVRCTGVSFPPQFVNALFR